MSPPTGAGLLGHTKTNGEPCGYETSPSSRTDSPAKQPCINCRGILSGGPPTVVCLKDVGVRIGGIIVSLARHECKLRHYGLTNPESFATSAYAAKQPVAGELVPDEPCDAAPLAGSTLSIEPFQLIE